MRHYELMVILDPELEERTVTPSLETYLKIIKESGGTVDKLDIWGRRRMSFEINKKPEGTWKYYHYMSDKIMSIENYKNGKLEGEKNVYYTNGQLAEKSYYKNNLLEGKYIKYAENGKPIEESNYKNGELNGTAIFYDGEGNMLIKGQYKKNKKSGTWETYENGKLVTIQYINSDHGNIFIKNENKGIAIAITGSWGIGKTFFWNEFIKERIKKVLPTLLLPYTAISSDLLLFNESFNILISEILPIIFVIPKFIIRQN